MVFSFGTLKELEKVLAEILWLVFTGGSRPQKYHLGPDTWGDKDDDADAVWRKQIGEPNVKNWKKNLTYWLNYKMVNYSVSIYRDAYGEKTTQA